MTPEHSWTSYLPTLINLASAWLLFYLGRSPEDRESYKKAVSKFAGNVRWWLLRLLPIFCIFMLFYSISILAEPFTRFSLNVVVIQVLVTSFSLALRLHQSLYRHSQLDYLRNLSKIQFLLSSVKPLPNMLSPLVRKGLLSQEEALEILEAHTKANSIMIEQDKRIEELSQALEREQRYFP